MWHSMLFRAPSFGGYRHLMPFSYRMQRYWLSIVEVWIETKFLMKLQIMYRIRYFAYEEFLRFRILHFCKYVFNSFCGYFLNFLNLINSCGKQGVGYRINWLEIEKWNKEYEMTMKLDAINVCSSLLTSWVSIPCESLTLR